MPTRLAHETTRTEARPTMCRTLGTNVRRTVILLSAIAMTASGCEREAKTNAQEKAELPAEPLQEVQYPTKDARYLYLDVEGRPFMVSALDDVPIHLRSEAAVLAGDLTQTAEDKVYRYDGPVEGGELATARLTSHNSFTHDMAAAWVASAVAARVWDKTVAQLPPGQLVSAPAMVTLGKGKGSNRAARSRTMEREPGVEVFSVNAAKGRSRSTTDQNRKNLAPNGWKPVTIYTAKWCGVCGTAQRWMKRHDVPHVAVDVERSKSGLADLQEAWSSNGITQGAVPTFEIGDNRSVMMGWDPETFKQVARR